MKHSHNFNAPPFRTIQLINRTGPGGAEGQLVKFLTHSDRTNWHHSVVVLNQSKPDTNGQALIDKGFTVHYCPESRNYFRKRLRWLTAICKATRPHLIHSWNLYANPYAAIAAKLSNVPLSIGSMRADPRAKFTQGRNWLHRKLAYKSVDHLIVNSANTHDAIVEMGIAPQKLSVVYNGVYPNEETVAPELLAELNEMGINKNHKLVISVGNLLQNKGMDQFVKGVAESIKVRHDIRGLIVGAPMPNEPLVIEQLEDLIETTGMQGRIHLLGFREDVPMLLKRADIFAFCSRSEGLPNAVVEALAAGCPVITTPVGDVPTLIVTGKSGVIIDVDDTKALTESILDLLNDEAKARQLANEGLAVFRSKFGCDRMAAEIEEVYQKRLVNKNADWQHHFDKATN